MTKEEKELLLRDLSTRLPYGVNVEAFGTTSSSTAKVRSITPEGKVNIRWTTVNIDSVKPYLRPMSSMTEEENKDYKKTFETYENIMGVKLTYTSYSSYDWLNAHHFDYRGLIDKGLAIEAPEGMYKENV
jgi:hypothetical protein